MVDLVELSFNSYDMKFLQAKSILRELKRGQRINVLLQRRDQVPGCFRAVDDEDDEEEDEGEDDDGDGDDEDTMTKNDTDQKNDKGAKERGEGDPAEAVSDIDIISEDGSESSSKKRDRTEEIGTEKEQRKKQKS